MWWHTLQPEVTPAGEVTSGLLVSHHRACTVVESLLLASELAGRMLANVRGSTETPRVSSSLAIRSFHVREKPEIVFYTEKGPRPTPGWFAGQECLVLSGFPRSDDDGQVREIGSYHREVHRTVGRLDDTRRDKEIPCFSSEDLKQL